MNKQLITAMLAAAAFTPGQKLSRPKRKVSSRKARRRMARASRKQQLKAGNYRR